MVTAPIMSLSAPSTATVVISRRGAERVADGHPWVYRSDIVDAGTAAPGDAVRVTDRREHLLGMAHYSAASEIAVRMLSSRERAIDEAFFRERIATARAHRERVVHDSDAYRLISSEADGLPALIVDRYAGWLALQTLNQGMDRAQPVLVEILREMFPGDGIYERNEAPVRRLEKLPSRAQVLQGEGEPRTEITFNGLRFAVDLASGQKTGMFLDQRENYRAAAQYARGKALDCFSYSGGFALHVARACESVEAVDSSADALAAATANAARNGIENVRWLAADVFDLLKGYDNGRRSFDTIILDPPAFARGRAQVEGALRGYKEINLRAMKMLEPGGVLVTCTCSHHIGEADFLAAIAEASIDARRRVTVLERRTQSADHPILLTVPETLYLKCLILRVDRLP
jgi:23S rRNA (cytosine1962-C5)-methyltransferase